MTALEGSPAATSSGPDVAPLREPGLPLWLRLVLPGVAIAVVVIKMLRPISDPDTLWHIRAGELLLETGQFVQRDPWSATQTKPWVLHQWLPEAVMALLNGAFGLPGVAWGATAAVAVLGLAVWIVLRKQAGLLITALILTVTVAGMSASLSPRPQIVSFVLTIISVHVWLASAHDARPRWWLIGLSWLWACSHGLWILGPLLGLVVIVGMALEGAQPRGVLARLSIVPIGSLAVGLLTPVGPQLVRSFTDVRQVAPLLHEWQPTPPTHPAFIAVAILVALPLLLNLRSTRRMGWVHILLLGSAAVFALLYGRTVAVAAAIAAPLAASALQQATRLKRERMGSVEKAITPLMVSATLAVTAIAAPAVASEPAQVPVGLNPALRALPSGTIICNQDAIGGWLTWEHPNVRPTLDTRMEIYGAEHVSAYAKFLSAQPGWAEYVDKTHCSAALLKTDTAVIEALRTSLHWREIGRSGEYALLIGPEPAMSCAEDQSDT